jgi:hypothetical protein
MTSGRERERKKKKEKKRERESNREREKERERKRGVDLRKRNHLFDNAPMFFSKRFSVPISKTLFHFPIWHKAFMSTDS